MSYSNAHPNIRKSPYQEADDVILASLTSVEDRVTGIETASPGSNDYLYTDVLFVSKDGLDTNSGRSPAASFLTIGAAITAATALTPSEANQILIRVLDSGVYIENLTLVAYVSLEAPGATLVGSLTIPSNCYVTLFGHYASDSNQTMVSKVNPSGSGFYTVKIQDARGLTGDLIENRNILNISSGSVLFVSVGVMYVTASGKGIADGGAPDFGHVHFLIADLYLTGNDAVGISAGSNNTNLIGYIDHILELGTLTGCIGIRSNSAAATVKVSVVEIIVATAISVIAGYIHLNTTRIVGDVTVSLDATLYALSPHVSGTVTNTGTIQGLIGGVLYNVT